MIPTFYGQISFGICLSDMKTKQRYHGQNHQKPPIISICVADVVVYEKITRMYTLIPNNEHIIVVGLKSSHLGLSN